MIKSFLHPSCRNLAFLKEIPKNSTVCVQRGEERIGIGQGHECEHRIFSSDRLLLQDHFFSGHKFQTQNYSKMRSIVTSKTLYSLHSGRVSNLSGSRFLI